MGALLFVYGTLKRGCRNHRHLAGQAFVGPARTAPGFTLYDLGGYPGIAAGLAAGGRDNLTALVVEILPAGAASPA